MPGSDPGHHGLVSQGESQQPGAVNTVRTTGIYCRSGCVARPLPKNVEVMLSPAAAEVAGFRPCLRCRPDRLPVALAASTAPPVVTEALVQICGGYLDDHCESDLGRMLGVSARHLRRLFAEAVGATPAQVALSRRAHFARSLLDDTDLPMTQVAFAAGFGSIRRMNDVMQEVFKFSPTALRAKRRRPACSSDRRWDHHLLSSMVAADLAQLVDAHSHAGGGGTEVA